MTILRVMLATISVAALLSNGPSAALAQADTGDCVYNPERKEMVCGDDDGGGDDNDLPEFAWGPWDATGYCVLPSGQSTLWERFLWRTADSAVVDVEETCIEPNWIIVWDEIAQVVAAVGVPLFEVAPPEHFGAVVGSPMLLWYSGQSQIPPITATVTDPTGVVYGVEGRGWIEQITWNMGDGSAVASSYHDTFDSAVFYGDFDNPAAEHAYELTSHTQGYSIDPDRCDLAFTPVSVTLTWTGEYRAIAGVLQTTWNPVPANLDITDTFEIPVREIRSWLISEDFDPPDDECTWTDIDQ